MEGEGRAAGKKRSGGNCIKSIFNELAGKEAAGGWGGRLEGSKGRFGRASNQGMRRGSFWLREHVAGWA